jgi:hypothetical protein
MNIFEESDSVLRCYAPLENPYCAALVEFSIDYREGLGAPYDLSAMNSVF